jgi:SWI/SNF-related matrix-associated actin-dependent regulator of chromatin subfamily A-like protein 1
MVELHAYQLEGVSYILQHKWVVVGDEPGLGKTAQALIAAERSGGQTLVVCPAYLISNWEAEVRKFTPNNAGNVDVISYSVQTMNRSRNLFERFNIIFDEIHYLKNIKAKRTELAHYLINQHKPELLIGLSGTPIKNRVEEWYSLIKLLSYSTAPNGIKIHQTAYDNIFRFCRHFSYEEHIKMGLKEFTRFSGTRNIEELKGMLKDKYLRRKADLLNLPDTIDIFRDLNKDQSELALAWKEYQEGIEKSHISTAKMQAAIDKTKYTLEYVRDLVDQGNKVVVFTDHVAVVEALVKGRTGIEAIGITGGTDSKLRQKYVDDFNNGVYSVLVATIGSASTGFNMVGANHLVFNDIAWVPADMEQARKRIHRMGQTKKCFYHYIFGGKIDQLIYKTINSKNETLNKIV